jgi:hypothetical protein
MINIQTSVDQKSLEEQELVTKLYSVGWFDGLIGCHPVMPEKDNYWHGYQLGCREYWAKKLEVKIPREN